ncbi:MAG TPA: bifunctional copper resistance protein CopD/cytochrome c oxidase assembly protein [Pseudonocardiaceae bacterium]|nr:bifunctional copper resistance protein CopD/cytochrome c oxidase assembly protein [Pseudonocardiaceae bacterium]
MTLQRRGLTPPGDPGARTAARRDAGSLYRPGGVLALGVLLAGALGTGLVIGLAGDSGIGLGLSDPGPLTQAGLPLARVFADCAAVLTAGSLLLAAFLVPPGTDGQLGSGGCAAIRAARISALAWTLSAVLLVPLSAADIVGRPVTEVLDPWLLVSLVSRLPELVAWALTAGIALVLAGFCGRTRSWGGAVWLLVLSLLGLTPVVLLTGHSSAGGAHDLALGSLLYHLLAAALWVGGLVALLTHLARGGEHAGLATARFSRLAGVCWLVMAASGVVNALVRVTPDRLLTSYGLLVSGKVAALLMLGVIGALHRRGSVAAVVRRGDSTAILRLGGVEVLIMFATIGLAVALSRTAPPGGIGARPTRVAALLGYDLPGPPTLSRLLLDWRPDLVLGLTAVGLAGAYLAGVRRLRRRGEPWPPRRTLAWLGGCAVILLATSSGLGRYSMALFSTHLGTQMLLSTLAPILLALGAPVTLGLRAPHPAGAGNPPGPREWLVAFTRSWVVRMSTQPGMALGMYLAMFWVMYPTGLFDALAASHWAHLVMSAHALLMGYPYYWIIVGADPLPHRLTPQATLGLLLAALPVQALAGIYLMTSTTVIGGDFYRSLALPFVPDLLADQRITAAMVWAAGQIPIVVVLVIILARYAVRANDPATRTRSENS